MEYKSMKKLILILSPFIILAGCNKMSENNIVKDINHHEFKLVSNHKITIGFDNSSVFGSAGVNRYMGSYTIKDNKISFSQMGTTMMMGLLEDMDNETAYLKSLSDNLSISYENNILTIGDNKFILVK